MRGISEKQFEQMTTHELAATLAALANLLGRMPNVPVQSLLTGLGNSELAATFENVAPLTLGEGGLTQTSEESYREGDEGPASSLGSII